MIVTFKPVDALPVPRTSAKTWGRWQTLLTAFLSSDHQTVKLERLTGKPANVYRAANECARLMFQDQLLVLLIRGEVYLHRLPPLPERVEVSALIGASRALNAAADHIKLARKSLGLAT